ncbi:TA system VapC family ribonuclease toxin [Agromyces sp. NPDC058484]|uniref:TA system VapC family ribonuclease toxin n=1 Tax=Agromyces sp. NPDC058484 TaxID=3346524 RepID=UPI00365EFA1E
MAQPVRLLDANVLIALVSEQHVHHAAAHRWLRTIVSWATTPMTEAAFVRLVSNPAVVGGEIAPVDALALLERVRRQPGHVFLADGSSLATAGIDLTALVGHRQVTDFHLVNLAAGAGAILATFDGRLLAALAEDDRRHVEVIPL